MMKKVFNKKSRQKRKGNLRKFSRIRKLLPKRMGGVIGVSVLMENRNLSAKDFELNKNEIL